MSHAWNCNCSAIGAVVVVGDAVVVVGGAVVVVGDAVVVVGGAVVFPVTAVAAVSFTHSLTLHSFTFMTMHMFHMFI